MKTAELQKVDTGSRTVCRKNRMRDLRRNVRLSVSIMVALVTSLSLNHSAMAPGAAPLHYLAEVLGHCGEHYREPYETTACGGIEHCVSVLLATSQETVPSSISSEVQEMRSMPAQRWMGERIDRPPKVPRYPIA